MRAFKIAQRYTDTSDNLYRYFNEISKYERLTAEKESELCFRILEGDEKAKEQVLKSNLRFVISVAKSYQSPGASLEDLISEGNKGLVEAIESFDPMTGFKFISYAVWHIRKNIFLYLDRHSRSIRIPININADMRKYGLLEESFISYNGRKPNIEEIIEMMDDQDSKMKLSNASLDAIKNNPRTVPLELPSDNDRDFSPMDYISSYEISDKELNTEDKKKIISIVLSELTDIERSIIIMRYGLDGKEGYTFSTISEHYGKSNEWARIICNRAEKKLRVIARRKKLNQFLF